MTALMRLTWAAALTLGLAGLMAPAGWAQTPPAKAQEEEPDPEAEDAAETEEAGQDKEPEKKEKTIADLVGEHDTVAGLFTFYRDPKSGAVHMEVRTDQLDKDYIYFTHVMDGPLEAGSFRGSFRDNAVFTLRRYYDRIEFVEENVSYYFDPENPLSRAADANISPAVLASAKIVAEDKEDGRLLIRADGVFLAEALHQVTPTPPAGPAARTVFNPGKLDKGRSKITDIRSYPANSDIRVDYVFANPKPRVRGTSAVTDPRAVTISLQHTLIAVPENNYAPRRDDPRVGYFFTRVTDLTDTGPTPYRDLIDRWHLEKKDPDADLSEPVEPIVWWIENTTPHEYREAIKKGALAWNEAFESAGFKNAIQVKVQPDDADWDAGDIRYNVLRWTSSPNPPFGGYGPNFVNPRTGQVLGSDIMLENVYVSNRLVLDKLFDLAGRGLPLDRPMDGIDPQAFAFECAHGHVMQLNTLFANTVLAAHGASEIEKKRIVEESLMRLTLHEIGHTLGLNHNMKASQLRPFAEMGDLEAQDGVVTGSVMDYPAVNIARKGQDQGHYYDTRPGPYDHWAIRFGYDPDLDEAALRAAHLARSSEPALAFGNDADDMRSPGRGNDPRVMIGDMSSDAIDFALNQIALVRETMGEVREKYSEPGQSWHELRNAYLVLTGTHNTAARVISRYVGGIYQDRAFAGQDPELSAPFVPVAYEDQKRAMQALRQYLFAPNAFDAPDGLLNHLQMQRRGFDHFVRPEDPKVHSRVLAIQSDILNHLMHPLTLTRLTDSRLYGNRYSAAEMMADLTSAVFEEDLRGEVNTHRQMLQIAYTKRLTALLDGDDLDPVAKSAVLASLKQLERWMERARQGSRETRAHRDHVLFLVGAALDPSKA